MSAADNLLIRADAGPTIGAGHVMRCLALAQRWQDEGGRSTFACSELPGALGDRLRLEGCDVVRLDVAVGSPHDAAATRGLSRDLDAVVVTDGYRFEADFQGALRGEVRALLVLDDHGQIGKYRADMILDQNLGATEDRYRDRPPECRLLLGPEYVMLRREFLTAEASRRDGDATVRRLLVTTGGADIGGLSGLTLDVLDGIPAPLDVTVVTGGAAPASVEAAVRNSHHRVSRIEDAPSMPVLMAGADLAVSAAGSTAWELAYMGVPSILGVVAANQRLVAAALASGGAALTFDGRSARAVVELRRALDLVLRDGSRRSALSEAARRLVDGRGVSRVRSRIREAVE